MRAGWLWLQALGSALALSAIIWLAAQHIFQLQLLNVQTGSMRPAFRPHDALIMQRSNPGQLRVGMVVSYHSARNPRELVTHRVIRVMPGSHQFQTRGDALDRADPPVQDNLLAGRVVAVLPRMGVPLSWLQSWPGLALCIYAPATAIAATELRRFERSLAGHYYVLPEQT